MDQTFLLYGANGYTGELVAREAARLGLRPVLAGRNRAAVTALAEELGLECRIFGLEDPITLRAGLERTVAVLNCAGPFVRTAWPLINACLAAGLHYLDITGEIGQFEHCATLGEQARSAGVMLLPGAGFDVVPSDCLAAHLKTCLPSAQRLVLGIQGLSGISRGTATTAVKNAEQGAFVRENGRIVPIPVGSRTRTIDFGRGPAKAVIMPWGDVATAYYSTGIPNIEVYFAFPVSMRLGLQAARYMTPLLKQSSVRNFVISRIQAGRPGPSAEQRGRGFSLLWGEVSDNTGQTATARLRTPEAYQLTVLTCLAIIKKVLSGHAVPGYQTPATAFGAGLVLEIPGVTLSDEPASTRSDR